MNGKWRANNDYGQAQICLFGRNEIFLVPWGELRFFRGTLKSRSKLGEAGR